MKGYIMILVCFYEQYLFLKPLLMTQKEIIPFFLSDINFNTALKCFSPIYLSHSS